MKRLQGSAWSCYKKSHDLKLACVSITKAGHYRVDITDEHGIWFYHYLNDREIERLPASRYLETHTLYKTEDLLYNNNRLLRQLRRDMGLRKSLEPYGGTGI